MNRSFKVVFNKTRGALMVVTLPKFGDSLKDKLGDYLPIVDKLGQQLCKLEVKKDEVNKIEHDTHVIIGGKPDNSPVLVGSVGGDRLLNANLNVDLSSDDNGVNLALIMAGIFVPNGTNPDLTFTRVGNTLFDVKSGNLFGHINGSSAINVGKILTASATLKKQIKENEVTITGSANTGANSTTTIIEGNSKLTIEGTGCVAGAFGGGSAIALGGNATSNVTGNTTIVINNSGVNDGMSIDSLSVGVVGGGLAVAGFGGTSSTATGMNEDNYTLLDLKKGVVVGAIGGGVAAAGDAVVQNYVDDLKLPGKVTVTSTESGTASSTSQKVLINLGKDVATAGVIGGGIAFADAFGQKDTNKGTSLNFA